MIKKVLAVMLVFILFAFAFAAEAAVEINGSNCAAAPWDTAGYRNENNGASSELSLRDALARYHGSVLYGAPNPVLTSDAIPALNARQTSESDRFKSAFVEGFRRDAYSGYMPFNWKYVWDRLEPIVIYNAEIKIRYPRGGYMDGFGEIIWNWIPDDGYRYVDKDGTVFSGFFYVRANGAALNVLSGDYPRTAIHEIGHILGLGESLTTLLSEEYSQNKERRDPKNWEFVSDFDRLLLDEAGAARFWTPAFTSNCAYGALWDEFMDVPFAELQLARTLNKYVLEFPDSVLAAEFYNLNTVRGLIGTNGKKEEVFVYILNAFMESGNSRRRDAERERADARQLSAQRRTVDEFFTEAGLLAYKYNLKPMDAVFEHILYGTPYTGSCFMDRDIKE